MPDSDTAFVPYKPTDEPAIRVVLMPKDTNAHGTIFGGVILSYIDIAAAVEVRKHTLKKIVTKAMHEVAFVAPVFVGDLVSFYTELVRIGRTSITIKVIVEADRVMNPGERARVTEAEVVYVAVDENRRPVPIRDEA
jgi:acyl-CoA thioesterase YciA